MCRGQDRGRRDLKCLILEKLCVRPGWQCAGTCFPLKALVDWKVFITDLRCLFYVNWLNKLAVLSKIS